MKTRLPIIISALAVAAMCGFIFFMSARPATESGAMSMQVVSWVVEFVVPGFRDLSPADQLAHMKAIEHVVRKAAHFAEYMLLGALVMNFVRVVAFRGRGKTTRALAKQAALAWLASTAYAATDELHQMFVPGRSCMATDILIDSAGAAVGIVLFVALIRCVSAISRTKRAT